MTQYSLPSRQRVAALLEEVCSPGMDALTSPTPSRWYIADPRPDLPADTDLWRHLLTAAHDLDGIEAGGLFGALHGLRCLGACLEWQERGLRLLPGEIDGEAYAGLRQDWLLPHAELLQRLLLERHPYALAVPSRPESTTGEEEAR